MKGIEKKEDDHGIVREGCSMLSSRGSCRFPEEEVGVCGQASGAMHGSRTVLLWGSYGRALSQAAGS